MPRPVKARENYVAERARLTRLEDSVLRDARLDEPNRVKIVETLRQLVVELASADAKLLAKRR